MSYIKIPKETVIEKCDEYIKLVEEERAELRANYIKEEMAEQIRDIPFIGKKRNKTEDEAIDYLHETPALWLAGMKYENSYRAAKELKRLANGSEDGMVYVTEKHYYIFN